MHIRVAKHHLVLAALLGLSVLAISGTLWADGQLVEEVVHFPSLEGNLIGDPADRNTLIYLPPSYASSPTQRYPVIYLLHGGLANNLIWVSRSFINYYGNFNIQTVMDRLIADGEIGEMIIVMPDANTVFQGNWYVNSPVLGNYEDYIVQELVQYIDTGYRTLPQRESRGIAGHSLGGYGAVYLGMKHAESYAAVYGHESTALEFEAAPDFRSGLPNVMAIFTSGDWGAFEEAGPFTQIELVHAAAFSPNADNAPFYSDWLWVEDGDQLRRDEVVWQRWQAFDPTDLIDQYKDNLLQLRALKFDGGTGSQTNIPCARVFDAALTEAGIPHEFEEFSGGHGDRTAARMESVILPFFSEVLSFAEMPTAVEASTWGGVKSKLGE